MTLMRSPIPPFMFPLHVTGLAIRIVDDEPMDLMIDRAFRAAEGALPLYLELKWLRRIEWHNARDWPGSPA